MKREVSSCGKQVLVNRQHFADAVSVEAAEAIAEALRNYFHDDMSKVLTSGSTAQIEG